MSTLRRGTVARGGMALLGGLCLVACVEPPPFEKEINELAEITHPPKGRLTSFLRARQADDQMTLRASWTIEVQMSWEEYVAWAQPRLAGSRVTRDSPDALSYGRLTEGDILSLRMQRKSYQDGILVIEASFEARPS